VSIDETCDSGISHSAVPPGLAHRLRPYPALPRWAKLGRPFQGLRAAVLFSIVIVTPVFGKDHPALLAGSECLSCHAEKTKGKSVHFDFTQACAVCHAVSTADGKTTITLVLPKEKICYTCHEKAAMDKVSFMKGECVSCHDPHNSERLHLLRANLPPSEGGQR
jgi:predicted CXXCH cytochrome family protein